MSKDKSPINIIVDEETKEKATEIFDELGLSMSGAITIFLRQIIKHDGLPFELKLDRKGKKKNNN